LKKSKSKAMDKRRKRGQRKLRPLIFVALVLFLVGDVALVGYALRGDDSVAISEEETSSANSPAVSTPTADPADVETETPLSPLAAQSSYLAVVDGTTAYPRPRGTCAPGNTAILEKSIDGGQSWNSTPVFTGLASVFRLGAVSDTEVFLAGLDGADCTATLATSYTSGSDFVQGSERLTGAWYVDPAVPAVVHSPTGIVAAPCDVVSQLASIGGTNAAVLCNDRDLHQTTDGGRTWSGPTSLSGAVALGENGTDYVFASTGSTACTGLEVSSMTVGATTATALGCASSVTDPAATTSISGQGQNLWVDAAGQITTSNDGGATWAP
jgi:hypothetical protein